MAPFPTSPWQRGWGVGWGGGSWLHILIKARPGSIGKDALHTASNISGPPSWMGSRPLRNNQDAIQGSGAVMAKSRGTGQEALA